MALARCIPGGLDRVEGRELVVSSGEAGDALDLVCTGRLQAIVPGTMACQSERIGAGGSIVCSPCSPARRARRRSERGATASSCGLHETISASFLTEPGFASALLSALGEQLRESRSLQHPAVGPPVVIAVAVLGGVPPARTLAESLYERLSAWSPVSVLAQDSTSGADLRFHAATLDAAEREGGRVPLVVGDDLRPSPWKQVRSRAGRPDPGGLGLTSSLLLIEGLCRPAIC